MNRATDHLRQSKVLRARGKLASGFYDAFLADFEDVLISGECAKSQAFLSAMGAHVEIQKETRKRVKLSFYAAVGSIICGFLVVIAGAILVYNCGAVHGCIVASVGAALSAY